MEEACRCERCGSASRGGDLYCRKCGTRLLATGTTRVESVLAGRGAVSTPPNVDPRSLVSVRIFSTFRWGELPGVIDCGSSIAFDDKVLGRWTPSGFDFVVDAHPGVHRIEVTPGTTLLGRISGWAWKRPCTAVNFDRPGRYEALLAPCSDGRDGFYQWYVSEVG